MPGEPVRFGFVIEGKGEDQAVPLLVRRICNEMFGFFTFETARPVRVTKSKLVRDGGLERAIRLARLNNGARGPVLVMLDADEDCPAKLGSGLKARALAIIASPGISVVIPKREFESWFLAAASSLGGKRGLREELTSPSDPEDIRGAKEWLNRQMVPGRKYSPTIDQAALVAGMDLQAARCSSSFDRLCRELERLLIHL